jgi:hypothetical protein
MRAVRRACGLQDRRGHDQPARLLPDLPACGSRWADRRCRQLATATASHNDRNQPPGGSGGRCRPSAAALLLALVLGAGLQSPAALGLPLYARQTGQPCATCHTAFLELTPFGRRFKLGGYQLRGGDWQGPPFAVVLQPGFTHTEGAQPGGLAPGFGVNNDFAMQQMSLFTGGAIADHLGAFIQGTYDGVAHDFAWDNTDIRYVRSVDIGDHTMLAGIDLNNNPTVQDVWNTRRCGAQRPRQQYAVPLCLDGVLREPVAPHCR